MAVNQFQRKHLQERITSASYAHKDAIRRKRAERLPKHVADAKAQIKKLCKIVDAYDAKQENAKAAAVKRVDAAARKCTESALFAEPLEALHLIRQFECIA